MLIVTLSILLVGCALLCDFVQRDTAAQYRDKALGLRRLVSSGELDKALHEHAYTHALWQHDEKWLNLIISHHHTRAVSLSLTKLETALSRGWQDEALRELDELDEALKEIESSDWPTIENIL